MMADTPPFSDGGGQDFDSSPTQLTSGPPVPLLSIQALSPNPRRDGDGCPAPPSSKGRLATSAESVNLMKNEEEEELRIVRQKGKFVTMMQRARASTTSLLRRLGVEAGRKRLKNRKCCESCPDLRDDGSSDSDDAATSAAGVVGRWEEPAARHSGPGDLSDSARRRPPRDRGMPKEARKQLSLRTIWKIRPAAGTSSGPPLPQGPDPAQPSALPLFLGSPGE